jgi:tetratricopeptide (TPR) repeat protein
MVARRTFFVVLLIGAVFTPWALPAQSQLPLASSEAPYLRILERYEAGDYRSATALPTLDEEQFQEGQAELLSAASTPRGAALMRVAIVAHTDAAIAIRRSTNALESRKQLVFAQRYAEKLQSRNSKDPVASRWWLLAIGYLHAIKNFREALVIVDRARRFNGDTPEVILALGVTHEMWWNSVQAREYGGPATGRLDEAEKAYKSVLAMDGSMLQARLRLARVRTLRGDNDAAVSMLGEVRERDDLALLYLARLFEGDALERQGAVPEAERRYEAAIELVPRAQSAHVALAHTRYMRGARKEAADEVLATVADQGAGEESDPWFWYAVGFASRIDRDLADLRSLLRR